MAGRLVTIANFDLPAKARLAHNALQEAGIKSTVADEQTVAMDWLLGNAIGWVKVQVLEEDAERAVAVLEESLGTDPVDEEALAAEAEAAEREEGSEPPALIPTPKPPIIGDGTEPSLSERDEYARRMVLAATFGLVIPLLWFYAIYLFLNAAFGQGPLSARSKSNLLLGGLLLVLGSMMAMILIRIYGDPFP